MRPDRLRFALGYSSEPNKCDHAPPAISVPRLYTLTVALARPPLVLLSRCLRLLSRCLPFPPHPFVSGGTSLRGSRVCAPIYLAVFIEKLALSTQKLIIVCTTCSVFYYRGYCYTLYYINLVKLIGRLHAPSPPPQYAVPPETKGWGGRGDRTTEIVQMIEVG